MNPKKAKEKERRRARKLADEAWDAVNDENLDLAEKIIRRAVATQPDNPVLWNDQGMVLRLRGKNTEAADSFRTAISLAPNYAEPFTHLAELRARVGQFRDAVGLMELAVKYAPHHVLLAERLESYRALVGQATEPARTPTSSAPVPIVDQAVVENRYQDDLLVRLKTLDWQQLGGRLTRTGCVIIPSLLDDNACGVIRSMFDNDSLFAKTVVMDREDFGKGVYRYFQAPVPAEVDGLRRAVYQFVAPIANDWQGLLNESKRFPATWEAFRGECHEAGQSTPTPILLKYGPGGFNSLHRDLRGAVFFPIQMAVVLSPLADPADPGSEGFLGGEFLLCDVPESKKSRRQSIMAGMGGAVLFCTRDRLVPIGGVFGLQAVKHGVATITRGVRVVLGVPFHEYR
jgi:hypothetical protein